MLYFKLIFNSRYHKIINGKHLDHNLNQKTKFTKAVT